ncbi:RHS repeat-associated core domain-containing protein, partial [Neisseria animaloris]|uniref:RHS repeat-associated core domain-containing protein n=1 Tax=Neisseria animaloris TaxID=326522 RepID=UPI0039DF78D2
ERDRLHQEIQRTQGALTSRYDYDPMGRLKHQTATANRTLQHNGKLNTLVGGVVRRSYRYDQAGNLIQTADQRSGVLDYVYDKLGRIESAVNKQTGSREKFAFDPAHNILSDKVSDGLKDKGLSEHLSDRHHISRTQGRNIGKGNRLQEYNGIEYTYDALGNMIYRQLPNGESQLFQYDTENQLVLAEIKKNSGESQTWEYAYDPFGRRLSKERTDKGALTATAPKQTHFVWDGSRLLQEYNYRGSYSYIYTDQDSYEPLAQVFDNHKDQQQYLFYFHNNQIGTPHEMTDIHGNLLWYGSYSAWGSLSSENKIYPNIHQPFRLQNQYCDAETGLHYNFFRYYDPGCGRFVTQDPIGLEAGSNLYIFAVNVQAWVDPLGLDELYALVARKDGWYPVMQWGQKKAVGEIYLKEGELWKIGTSKNASKRYSQRYLDSIGPGVDMKIIHSDISLKLTRLLERMRIRGYEVWKGFLPPGNKCRH